MMGHPSEPTWTRWKWVNGQRMSLLRALEYEKLSVLRLRGMTLDVGGGAAFEYNGLVAIQGKAHTVNIATAVRPTVVADLNQPLPLASESYDSVISFNTLEHVENDRLALSEMIRVLKPEGSFHFTVPFLYKRHGKYGDFHRHTAEWWEHCLCSIGLAPERFSVVPLQWSPLSSAASQLSWFGGGRKGRLIRRLVLAIPLIVRPFGRSAATGDSALATALGFYISGTKSSRRTNR
jgi:SAM-dependent methyltransferase